MGQQEILTFLKKRKVSYCKEISEKINVTISSVWFCLSRLEKAGDVEKIPFEEEDYEKFKISKAGRGHYLWKIKNAKKI